MRVDDFFRNHFEAHLLADMATLEAVRLPPGANGGGVGYPLLATAIAGTELLGALNSTAEFDPWAGQTRFTEWWQTQLYTAPPERDVAPAVYMMVRNWVLHTFVGRDPFTVTMHGNTDHLRAKKDASGLAVEVFLDATQYAQDVRASYLRVVEPALASPGTGLWTTLDARLQELLAHHHKTWAKDVASLHGLTAIAAPGGGGPAVSPPGGPALATMAVPGAAIGTAPALPVLHILTNHTKSIG